MFVVYLAYPPLQDIIEDITTATRRRRSLGAGGGGGGAAGGGGWMGWVEDMGGWVLEGVDGRQVMESLPHIIVPMLVLS